MKNKTLFLIVLLFAAALSACGKKDQKTDSQTKVNENMEFMELVKTRRSIRNYLTQEVEQDKIDYIMESARLAPSAVNAQPWFFYIVKSEEGKKAIRECYPAKWLENVPVYIVACGNSEKAWKRGFDGKNYMDVDVAIAFEHIVLAATAQGLGTCWIGHFDPLKLTELLNIPSHLTPVAITPIGYPHPEQGNRTTRKPIEEIIKVI